MKNTDVMQFKVDMMIQEVADLLEEFTENVAENLTGEVSNQTEQFREVSIVSEIQDIAVALGRIDTMMRISTEEIEETSERIGTTPEKMMLALMLEKMSRHGDPLFEGEEQ